MKKGEGQDGSARLDDWAYRARRTALDDYEMLCEALPVAILHADEQDQCVYTNAAWRALSGRPVHRCTGLGWRSAIHPLDREWVLEEIVLARGQCRMFQADFRLERPDGSSVWVEGKSVVRHSADGHLVGYVYAIAPIEDRRLIEEELRQKMHAAEDGLRASTQRLMQLAEGVRSPIELAVSQLRSQRADRVSRVAIEQSLKALDQAGQALDEVLAEVEHEAEDADLDDVLF